MLYPSKLDSSLSLGVGVALDQGDRVLDVGTGPGLVAAVVAERGADVVGIDFSETMLAKARRLHAGIEFKLASAESYRAGHVYVMPNPAILVSGVK